MTVIGELLAEDALFRLRAAQGVLGLAEAHTPERLEAACVKAIAAGDPSYRTIKGLLAAGLEADPPPPATGEAGAAAFLHGPSRLFVNVVALSTTDATANAAVDTTTASGDHGGSVHHEPSQGVSA